MKLRREEIDESPHRNRAPVFEPRELRAFQQALAELRLAAGPIAGRSETRSPRDVDSPHPDAIRERQRLYLRRILKWLAVLSRDIVYAIHEDRYEQNPWDVGRRNCLACKSRNRDAARYCDHCGLRLPAVP